MKSGVVGDGENICKTVWECEHLDNSERDDEDDYDEDGVHHHD